MNRAHQNATPTGPCPRSFCTVGAVLALLLLPIGLLTGCGDELEREFRQAAIGGVETGLRSIADGMLDGVFAIAEPSSGSTSTGGTTAGG